MLPLSEFFIILIKQGTCKSLIIKNDKYIESVTINMDKIYLNAIQLNQCFLRK